MFGWRVGWEVADPVVERLVVVFWPLADQPLLTGLLLGPVFPAPQRTDAQERKLAGNGLPVVGIFPESDGMQVLRCQALD